jgi:hypothetical protein
VAARLGFDPFFPWAPRTVVAEIAHTRQGFHGSVDIVDEHGLVIGERTFDSRSADCGDVMRAMALAISIAVDDFTLEDVPPPPVAAPEPAPEPPPSVTLPAELPPTDVPKPAVPAPAEQAPLLFAGTLVPALSFGTAPAPASGASIGLEVRYRRVSIGLEGRLDLPASSDTPSARTSLALGAVVPCVRLWPALHTCAVVEIGRFDEEGIGVSQSHSDAALFAAAGVRVALEMPISDPFFVVARADALAVLTRHDVQIDGQPVFQISPIVETLGFGMGARF